MHGRVPFSLTHTEGASSPWHAGRVSPCRARSAWSQDLIVLRDKSWGEPLYPQTAQGPPLQNVCFGVAENQMRTDELILGGHRTYRSPGESRLVLWSSPRCLEQSSSASECSREACVLQPHGEQGLLPLLWEEPRALGPFTFHQHQVSPASKTGSLRPSLC